MRTGIALFILLALVVGCAPAGQDNASVASLENVAGTVTVNGKDTTGAALYVGDVIATGADAKAQVVFSDSAVLRLDANTEITIKGTTDTNVAVFQSSGQTWSRVLHLSGISDYEIETATTTASVRGTGFKVKVNKDDTEVAVGEGEVEVSTKKDGKVLKRQMVRKLQRAMVRHDMLDRMEMSAMADDAFMESNLDEDEAFIDLMVRRFAKRHPRIVNALKEAGYTQEDAHAWMKDLATGEMTVDEMRATLKDAMQDLEKEGVVREATDEQDSIETEQATGERETDTTTIETEQDTIEQEVVEIEARDLCVDETDKDSCYNERAAETNDATHCTSIQAQDTKDNCLSMVAINTKNDALCTDVVDNEVRTVCEQNIRSDNRITGDMMLITD